MQFKVHYSIQREREREVQRNTIFDSSSNILSYLKSKLAWNVVLFLDKFRRRSLRKKVRMGNTRKYTHVRYHAHTSYAPRVQRVSLEAYLHTLTTLYFTLCRRLGKGDNLHLL